MTGMRPASRIKRSPTRVVVFIGIIGLIVLLPVGLFAWSFFLPTRCIVEGTWVDTPTGPRRIEDLRVGDDVRSRAPDGSYRIGKVVRSTSARAFKYLRIPVSGGEGLRVTGAHPIWTAGAWVPAEELRSGMPVEGPGGSKRILSIEPVYAWVRVYDLEVAPDPNFVASGVLVHNKSSNERNAHISLKTIVMAQFDFREYDRDGNQMRDYWVGDVAHLSTFIGKDGKEIGLIERSVALADAAPLEDLSRFGERSTKAGYLYATIPLKADGTPYDHGDHRNFYEYAFCAFPARREAGRYTLIVNESGVVYRKDILKAARVPKWPSNLEAEGWSTD